MVLELCRIHAEANTPLISFVAHTHGNVHNFVHKIPSYRYTCGYSQFSNMHHHFDKSCFQNKDPQHLLVIIQNQNNQCLLLQTGFVHVQESEWPRSHSSSCDAMFSKFNWQRLFLSEENLYNYRVQGVHFFARLEFISWIKYLPSYLKLLFWEPTATV